MNVAALLTEFETLSDARRLAQMREIGRQAASDPEAASVISALEDAGFYERRLALHSCFTHRDGAQVVRAFLDASRRLRNEALMLAPIACTDAQILSILQITSLTIQKALLNGLSQRKRYEIIDTFLKDLPPDDDRRERLLSYGSAAAVQSGLEAVQERMGVHDWKRLARLHPGIAIAHLQKRAEAATRLDQRLLYHANVVLPMISSDYPEEALNLVHALLRHAPLSRLLLATLAQRRPNEVAALVLAHEGDSDARFETLVNRLDDDLLLDLARNKPQALGRQGKWLALLSPSRRAPIFEAIGLSWRDWEGATSPTIIKLLPAEFRIPEARRCLRLPALATRPQWQFPYASLLPWDESRATLEPYIRDPDPELRGGALPALIKAARYNPARLTDALALVRARSNEQDPIRLVMLTALATLPGARWSAAHREDLAQILQDALDAADRSPATSAAAEKLVLNLVPHHPEWAAAQLAILTRASGRIYSQNLEAILTNEDVRQIAPTLTPVFQAWRARESNHDLIGAAQQFGRRLPILTSLMALLEEILLDTSSEHRAARILTLIDEHYHFRVHSLIPHLLNQDPSWITQATVYLYIHRRRQDLITPFLGQHAYSGRFATGKTRFVMPLDSGFERWTPRQQAIFARTLEELVYDSERNSFSRIGTINALTNLTDVAPTTLIALAAPDQEAALRDSALRALARRDSGDGVVTLTDALSDSRARIAIYALRAALREMPPERALALLAAAPMDKVTVAKEVIRLTGEIKSEESYQALHQYYSRNLHRDARVALLRAFWDYLERDETWPILSEAAVSLDPAIASGVIRIPLDRLSARAQSRVTTLIATLLTHPEPRIRLNVLQRCVSLPLPDRDQALLPPLLASLGSKLPDECAAAANAVFATYAAENALLVGTVVRQIRDDRRALRIALGALSQSLARNRMQMLSAVRAVIDALAGDPMTINLRIELGARALPSIEVIQLLTDAAQSGALHADVLHAADVAIADVSAYGIRNYIAHLEKLESQLRAASDERLRRLGFSALIALSRTSRGWDEALLASLREYREDASVLVAAAAQFTLPAAELETPQNSHL